MPRNEGVTQNDGGERLRKDAAENRAKLLDAARSVFGTQGVNAPLESVAAKAGVGIATLYRRFPTREDLLAAIVREELGDYLTALEDAHAETDAWVGFSLYVRRMFRIQARSPGLCDAPYLQLPDDDSLDHLRARLTTMIDELIERAKLDGSLRQDITAYDVELAGYGHTGVINHADPETSDAFERYERFILAAFRAPGSEAATVQTSTSPEA